MNPENAIAEAVRATLEPRVCDLIFTRWPGCSARLTCAVTRGPAAHQEMIDEQFPQARVIAASGAMGRMVRWEWEGRKAYFAETKTEWCRFTLHVPLDLTQRTTVAWEAEKQFNTFKYSKGELLLQGLDSLRAKLTGRHTEDEAGAWARRLGDMWGDGVICSKAGNLPLIRVGLLPGWARFWSPNDTLRHVQKTDSGWRLAEATEGWEAWR